MEAILEPAYVKVREGVIGKTVSVDDLVNLNYDLEGNLLGVEVLPSVVVVEEDKELTEAAYKKLLDVAHLYLREGVVMGVERSGRKDQRFVIFSKLSVSDTLEQHNRVLEAWMNVATLDERKRVVMTFNCID